MSSHQSHPHPRQVASFDGVPIHYDLYGADSPTLILIVPGFWRNRRYPSMPSLAAFLLGLGYRVAIVDVRGHGQSGGRYGFNSVEHEDVAAVARDLLRDPAVRDLVLLGFSVGGAIAISTAARHELSLRGLLLISPVADLSMIRPRLNPFALRRHVAFSQAFSRPRFDWNLGRRGRLRALEDIEKISLPVCLIHVRDDWLVSHRHSEALFERAPQKKELHVLDLEGNYHADRIFSRSGGQVEALVENFLRQVAPLDRASKEKEDREIRGTERER